MADSFFGFDTSLSNLDDEGGGPDCPEEEYDALNDETFGNANEYDWEMQHEQLAEQIENNRRGRNSLEESHSMLEASLSQLVLDETDAPHHSNLNSSVWQNDHSPFGFAPTPVSALKNVCTVEEIERQMRQKHQQQQQQQQMPPQQMGNNFFQPRFSMILQRPPGLQAPVQLPYQQPMHNTNHPPNMMHNTSPQMSNGMPMPNQHGAIGNQLGQMNQQMGQMNQQMGQINQPMGQINQQMGQMNQMGQLNQMGNQMGQMGNQMGQMGQINNQMGQMNVMGNVNQFIQNTNPNSLINQSMMNNQFGVNQFMQPRMVGPPGLNVQRQNFSPNMGQNQMNANFRAPTKPIDMMPQQMYNQSMNQSLNQSMNQQSPPNKSNQKGQKNRVIYNSNQKNMNSQNLVQMIQNTHPMLQFNNSFHNANHHPMLNRNGFNHPVNQSFNQRNGSFSNRHMSNGDESTSNQEKCDDEYAGLMSQREKQWLINIQMLQLNTGTPYMDDFYYTVFLERKSRKEKEGVKEAHKANQQNHPFYASNVKENHRERHNSNRHNSQGEDVTPRTYVPTQFENSLGKLQCGSVTAPRKIIEVEVVMNEGGTTTGRTSRAASVASTANEAPREVKRTKQLLLDIEALYLILLRLEELNEPLAISNALILKEREEKQKLVEAAQKEQEEQEEDTNLFLRNIESVHKKPKTDSPKTEIVDKRQVVSLTPNQNPSMTARNLLDENKDDLINKMFAGLLYEDRLQQFMMVRKGKCLICRFVCRVPPSHSRLRVFWSRVLRCIGAASRRDQGTLPALAPHYRQYIQCSNGWPAVLESASLLSEAFDPARTPYALLSPFTLSCVCSLIEKASSLINTTEVTTSQRQWTKFLKTFARALKNTNLKVARPVLAISESRLSYHIKQVESRYVIEILQRGKTAEFDLSKAEFAEILKVHLC